jgi:hypothetical protein
MSVPNAKKVGAGERRPRIRLKTLLYKAKLYLLLSIDRVMPNKKIVDAGYDAP